MHYNLSLVWNPPILTHSKVKHRCMQQAVISINDIVSVNALTSSDVMSGSRSAISPSRANIPKTQPESAKAVINTWENYKRCYVPAVKYS